MNRILTTKEIDQFNHYGESVKSEDNWDIGALLKAQDSKTLQAVGEWLEKRIVGGTANTLVLKGWGKEKFLKGELPE